MFTQKKELKKTDKYRKQFTRLVVSQEQEVEGIIDGTIEHFDRTIKDSKDGNTIDEAKATKGLSKALALWGVLYLSTLTKYNAETVRVVGDQQSELIDKTYHNSAMTREITQISKNLESTFRKSFPARKWITDGISIGTRIKTIEKGALKTAQDIIRVGIDTGKSSEQIADDLDDWIKPNPNKKWVGPFDWFRDRFGYKVKRVPTNRPAGSLHYNSIRIARTEINQTYRSSTLLLHKDKDYIKGWDWNLSSSHPKPDICLRNCDILTESGWSPIAKIREGIKVAQFTDDHKIEFVLPSRIIHKKYNGDIYTLHLPWGNKLEMTEGHNQPLWSKKQKKFITKPIEKTLLNNLNMVYAGKGTGNNNNLTAIEKLMISYQADGSSDGKHGRVVWHFSKERKIKRLKYLCKEANIELKEYKNGYFSCYLPKKSKKLSEMFNVDMGVDRAKDFIKEISVWDGSVYGENYCIYFCKEKENLDFVSAIAVQVGYRINLTGKNWMRLTMTKKPHAKANACKITKKNEKTKVHCVTVPSSKIVVRTKGGMAVVTGNCDDWAAGSPYTDEKEVGGFGHPYCMCYITPVLKTKDEIDI